jgi:putative ABC transport system permease protein
MQHGGEIKRIITVKNKAREEKCYFFLSLRNVHMKKYILIVFSTTLILYSLYFIFFLKEYEKYCLLSKDVETILIHNDAIDSDDLIGKLELLAKEHNVVIFNPVLTSDKNIVIYSTDIYLNGKMKFYTPVFKEKTVLSNRKLIKNSNYSRIKFLDNRIDITLKEFMDSGNVVGNNFNIDLSESDLSIKNFINVLMEEIPNCNITLYEKSVMTLGNNLFLLAASILLTTCFFLLLFYFCRHHAKNIAILNCFGGGYWCRLKFILLQSLNPILVSVLINFLFTIPIIIFYLKSSFKYVFFISCLISLGGIFLWFVSSVILLLLPFNSENIVIKLKNKHYYKGMMVINGAFVVISVIFMLFSLKQLTNAAQLLTTKFSEEKIWKQAQNTYQIYLRYNGEFEVDNERKTSLELYDFVENFEEENADIFIMDASNFQRVPEVKGNPYIYELNDGDSILSANGRKIIITPNYLTIHETMNQSDTKRVLSQIIWDDRVRNILVPEEYQVYEDSIAKSYLKNFFYKKVEVENIYLEKFEQSINTLEEKDLKINIIYVPDGLSYFTYKSMIQPNVIDNPIVEIETFNIDISYLNMYASGCMFFRSIQESPYDYIKKYIPENTRNIGVKSVYTQHAEQLNTIEAGIFNQSISVLSIAVAVAIIMYNWIFLIYQVRRKKIMVYKVFGCGFWKINSSIYLRLLPAFLLTFWFNFYMELTLVNLIIIYLYLIIITALVSKNIYNRIIINVLKGGE